MATTLLSQEELLEQYKNEAQNYAPELTDFSDGSSNQAFAGIAALASREMQRIIVQKFNATFINTAHGPELSPNNQDDLAILAVDHFGDNFARPAASKASGVVTFSRATTDEGNVTIPAGTVVKTIQDANGTEQRFITGSEVTMTGLTINASVEAVEANSAGNVNASKVVVIESSLTDSSVTVSNSLAFVGGDEASDDSEYREFLRNNIEVIRGATATAITAAALNVSGVEFAATVESIMAVIEWDIGSSSTIGDFFRIPRVQLYIADANGTASAALIASVIAAIASVKASGVKIDTIAATPFSIDWTATITLNPGGPNFATLSTDTTQITDSMKKYIQDLAIGTNFNRDVARLAILAIWGPSGTNDLSDFQSTVPSGNVVVSATDKLLPGTIVTA